ncbi:O-antigen ligase family protein [Nitrosomonas sp. GH22]|uniref:O-antigen ligase family protein n=1 Tax=Nitrosomonas sp. GH22 TaxID=153947 RepID=UPI001F044920|nr:O-antigen ligase family protein [Nitrosomonas sp. GH22]
MSSGIVLSWRELLVRFVLVFFCLALWPSGLVYWGIGLLVVAWLVDGGLSRFPDLLKEPLIQGVLVFCGVWGVGLLWSDFSVSLTGRWEKYFILLIIIPFFSLLNKERLPWVTGALISGYLGVVVLGGYQYAVLGEQGISLFGMSYLNFSSALGIGVILAVYGGWVTLSRMRWFLSALLWITALLLLFLQFRENARGILLSTVMILLLMFCLRYQVKGKVLASYLASIIAVTVLFAASSDVFHKRLEAIGSDLQLFQQGHYQTSVGYRLAIWDIGLHGLVDAPVIGHGSGMAKHYLQNSFMSYKEGIYQDLPEFHEAKHFHNELIEIGVHLGLLGILAFIFLLWCWFKTFKQHQMALLGGAIVCFTFLSGLTDTFLLYSRIPPFLLAVTAIAVCWQRYEGSLDLIDRKSPQIKGGIRKRSSMAR